MIEKKMTDGTPFVVDDIDADLMEVNWYRSEDGYAFRWYGSKRKKQAKKTFLHKVILERKIERKLEQGEMSDHKDRNKQNNQRYNLRLASRANNMQNIAPQKNNHSGYKGVCYKKDGSRLKRWHAQININHRTIHIGYYLTPEEAARAYDKHAQLWFGEFAYLNFP